MSGDTPANAVPPTVYRSIPGGYAQAVGSVGENLRKLRTDARLTQEELAKRARVRQGYISKWEQGHSQPDLRSLIRLAVGLERPLDTLVMGVDEAYDLICQSLGRRSASSAGGAADELPASARRQLAELNDRLAKYETALGEMQDVASRLVKIAVAARRAKGGAPVLRQPGRSGRDRKIS